MEDIAHLHFLQSLDLEIQGGLGTAVRGLHGALIDLGISSTCVSTFRQETGFPESENRIFLSKQCGPKQLYFSFDLFRAVKELEGADVIHGHGFYVATNWIFGRATRRLGKPLIYHPHGFFDPWILSRSIWKKRIAHFIFENANFRYARLWRALTSKEADQIRAQGIVAPIVVIPNGIEAAPYRAARDTFGRRIGENGRKILIFLSRVHPKKGLLLLVAAWKELPSIRRKDWKVLIFGPDEGGHSAEIQAMVSQLELEDEIELRGPVTGESKFRALGSAAAFVLPSLSEGFSMAVLEAMAAELPVLVTEECNIPEVAAWGAGWSVFPSVEGIKRGLNALLEASLPELQEMGRRGGQLVREKFSWPDIASQLNLACVELLNK